MVHVSCSKYTVAKSITRWMIRPLQCILTVTEVLFLPIYSQVSCFYYFVIWADSRWYTLIDVTSTMWHGKHMALVVRTGLCRSWWFFCSLSLRRASDRRIVRTCCEFECARPAQVSSSHAAVTAAPQRPTRRRRRTRSSMGGFGWDISCALPIW